MSDERYHSLTKKYNALLEENESLRAKIRELEFQQNIYIRLKPTPLQKDNLKQRYKFDSGQNSFDSPANTEFSSENTINQYSPVNEKISLFMSLFRGRNDLHAKKWQNKKGFSG